MEIHVSDERLLLTVPETAGLLRLSPRRLYALIAQHKLPEGVVVRFGRAVRVSQPRLRGWLGADTFPEAETRIRE